MGLGGVIRLLGETTEGSLGIPLAPHVLNHHQISLACPPAGVGQGHGRGKTSSIGLSHQQGRPRSATTGLPQTRHQPNAIPEEQLRVVLDDL